MKIQKTTSVFLFVSGLATAVIGLGGLFAPELLAAPLGFALDNASARNEFRANYGGMLFLLGGLTAMGARRREWHGPALALALCFSGGLVLGRLVSLLLGDGAPGLPLYIFGGIELLVATGAALLLRCRSAAVQGAGIS
ncbi:MAG: DUF4345 domain-containing protein [bacterium]|nr:DUF4345 domain-containing protein [bacterium]